MDISSKRAPSPAAAPAKGQQDDNATPATEANSTLTNGYARPDENKNQNSNSESENSAQTQSTPSLLSSLWSPISTLLQSSKPSISTANQNNNSKKEPDTNAPTSTSPSPSNQTSPSKESQPQPEPYYTPTETPKFKALQKKRLSGIRTKQLLRAASRAYNDPPPPPDLGTCCGSSCDPCVNDLWREERDVWRERWGDRRVEGGTGGGGGREGLEW